MTREIDERMEFLEEMQNLGPRYVRKYQAKIKAEIADKVHQLEMLRIDESETVVAETEASEDLFKT